MVTLYMYFIAWVNIIGRSQNRQSKVFGISKGDSTPKELLRKCRNEANLNEQANDSFTSG